MFAKRIVWFLGTATALAFLLTLVAPVAADRRQASERAAQRAAQEDAFRAGGFVAAAALTGSYVREVGPGMGEFDSLDELVAASQMIVVGTIKGNRGVLVPRGDAVRTHYQVEVERFLKGSSIGGQPKSITVSVIGGRAALPGQRLAQEIITGFTPPANGERYVWFLNSVPAEAINDAVDTPEAEYWPTLQRHGLFRLIDDGVRPSDDRRRSPASPTMKYRRAGINQFLSDIRVAVAKQGGQRAR